MWSVTTGRNGTQGPTASRYCLAITRATWATCPKSCTTQAASSCWSVTLPRPGCSPGRSSSRARELPRAQQLQIRGTELGKLGHQGLQGTVGVSQPVSKAIVGFEADIWSLGKDDAGARDPIGLFTVDEMSDVVERTERFGTFGASNPRLAQAVQERPDAGGRTSKHLYRQVEIEIHRVLTFTETAMPCSRVRRRSTPANYSACTRLRAVSASFPNRDISSGRASMSPREVWKFTTQALKTNVPSMSALDRNASPLFSTAVRRC